ncbi:MAG: thioesterase family protein [Rubrivivax sp.]|nr:thioesterase family protein [Rubrivivax sp.]
MTDRRSAAEQARFETALTHMFEHSIRFNAVLGLTVASLAPGEVQLRLPMKEDLVGHFSHGRIHGGAISATLDALGGLALMVELAERHPADSAEQVMQRFSRFGTIDLRVDYLRPGLGTHFVGRAEVTRLGGRVGSVQCRLHNDQGTLIATSAAAYVVA